MSSAYTVLAPSLTQIISIEAFVDAMRQDLDDFIGWWYAQHTADSEQFPLTEYRMRDWADQFAAFGGVTRDAGYGE